MPQEFLGRLVSNARNLEQFCGKLPPLAAGAMERDGEPMGLVADLLDQVQRRGVVIQHDGLILAPVGIKCFFSLGDASQRLVDDP